MLRATIVCSLLSLFLAAPAAAEERTSSWDCELGLTIPVPLAPIAPAWCESANDPRCAPAAPAPSAPLSAAGIPLGTAPAGAPTVAPPPLAVARPPRTFLLGPSAEVRTRIERPPAA
ncbi:MAG: hypothetical protein H5U40_04285 [Polyangiaceae bacterium]|nr:hypothetical protein [Polyangiaceae bacterium]